MTVGVVVETTEQCSAQLALGVALATARGAELRVFHADTVGAEADLTARVARACKDVGRDPPTVSVHPFDPQLPGALLRGLVEHSVGTLLVVRVESKRGDALRHRVLTRASCEVLVWSPRRQDGAAPHLQIAVPMARGSHARAALRMAVDLAGEDGSVAALYVEPDVGVDARAVGGRVLDRLVAGALGDRSESVRREVVIGNQVWRGILAHIEESRYDLVLLGASKRHELRQKFYGTVGLRVSRADVGVSVGIVRGPAAWVGRVRSLLERWVLRSVPQLERDGRIALVERVQSNSYWDFDFIALMSMATTISAVGLVQDSEPVVIGAMLVAPLMTPILGLGLSLVHGNPVLGRAAMRTVTFGFLMAFAIGFALGALQPAFEVPTHAMVARNWPIFLDLIVAFVAGFAGAYAMSRASLFAALPGVAIAAALVPPIATSGLAVALGDWSLAAGASMLFFTNMVAIILASAMCLWLVGMRDIKPRSRANRLAGFALIAVVLALGAWYSPSHVPSGFRDAVRADVPKRYRIDGPIRTQRGQDGHTIVVIRLAGAEPPTAEVATRLLGLARSSFAANSVEVRVAWQWERLVAAPR